MRTLGQLSGTTKSKRIDELVDAVEKHPFALALKATDEADAILSSLAEKTPRDDEKVMLNELRQAFHATSHPVKWKHNTRRLRRLVRIAQG